MQTQQVIESDKVVNMHMRNENIADSQQLTRRQCVQETTIKKQGSLLPAEIHKQGGVPGWTVDQLGQKGCLHSESG